MLGLAAFRRSCVFRDFEGEKTQFGRISPRFGTGIMRNSRKMRRFFS